MDETHDADTDEIARMRALWCEEKSKAMTFHAEVDRLRAEVAALKAQNDPLAEMWRELAEYQPQADRDGHGESWRAMCSEKTHAAALAASRVATWVATRVAGRAAGYAAWADSAAHHAHSAIAEIRRAKEVQP